MIMFSGGADSTLVLHRISAWSGHTHRVRTLSITYHQIGAGKEQRAARRAILAQLRRRGAQIDAVEVSIVDEPTKSDVPFEEGSNSLQPALWITQAVLRLRNNEILYTGHVRGDDFWHARYDAHELFRSECAAMGKTDCKMEHPLEWSSKAEVLKELHAVGLLDLTWTCEFPENAQRRGKPCGKCRPCEVRRAALRRY